MPDMTTLVIGGAVWAALLMLAWTLCAAASRGGQDDRVLEDQTPARRPTVVADTGAIRSHLSDALAILEAEQLTVSVDIDGREAVLATARGVVEARAGRRPKLAIPIRVGERKVATLAAERRPGERRFTADDTLMLQKVAVTVGAAMETERSSRSVPISSPSAMA